MPELTKDARMLDGNVLEDEYSHSLLGPCNGLISRGLISPCKFITESTVRRTLAGGVDDARPIGSEPQPSHSVRYSLIARRATDRSHPRRARHAAFRGFGNHGHDLAAKPFAKFLGDRQGFKTPATELLLFDLVRTSATLLILAVQVPCIDGKLPSGIRI
jgi:hypothetical protein